MGLEGGASAPLIVYMLEEGDSILTAGQSRGPSKEEVINILKETGSGVAGGKEVIDEG